MNMCAVLQIRRDERDNLGINFHIAHLNVSCDPSLKLSCQDGSSVGSPHLIWLKYRKKYLFNYPQYPLLSGALVYDQRRIKGTYGMYKEILLLLHYLLLQLQGPSMFAVKAKLYGVLYYQLSFIAFDEISSFWSARKAPNFSAFHWSPHGSLVSIGLVSISYTRG